jgi:hypothetical protein
LIHLAFRFDDPSRTSDHDLERAVLGRFRAASIRLTAAVVPFTCGQDSPQPLTAEAVPHLLAYHGEGTLEVAQHGYCHHPLARLANGNRTEFAGIDPPRQRRFLIDGKAYLEDIFGPTVSGFVPPWNSYDHVTLDLLSELGFRYLSADWSAVGKGALRIPVMPHTCNLEHLKEAITEARRFGVLGTVVIAILHHFDFAESNGSAASMDLARLGQLLAWINAQSDITCVNLGRLASVLQPRQYRRNLGLARWRRRLHWRLQRLFPRYSLLGGQAPGFAYALVRQALLGLPRAMMT